jgi:hypothetical protein
MQELSEKLREREREREKEKKKSAHLRHILLRACLEVIPPHDDVHCTKRAFTDILGQGRDLQRVQAGRGLRWLVRGRRQKGQELQAPRKTTDDQVKHAKLDKNKIKDKSGIKSVGFNEFNIWANDSDAISVSKLSMVRGVTVLSLSLISISSSSWPGNATRAGQQRQVVGHGHRLAHLECAVRPVAVPALAMAARHPVPDYNM